MSLTLVQLFARRIRTAKLERLFEPERLQEWEAPKRSISRPYLPYWPYITERKFITSDTARYSTVDELEDVLVVHGRYATAKSAFAATVLQYVLAAVGVVWCVYHFFTDGINWTPSTPIPWGPLLGLAVWIGIPFAFLKYCWHAVSWFRYHFLTPELMLSGSLWVEFAKDGIHVFSERDKKGRGRHGTYFFPFGTYDLAFRVVDHPIGTRNRYNTKLDPFIAIGRVELIVGQRRVVVADIAWRDTAIDVAAALNWALQRAQAGTWSEDADNANTAAHVQRLE